MTTISDKVTEGTRDTIDLVAIRPEGGVVLGMVWLEPLTTTALQVELQKRVNIYLAYWDSGQLAADFPDTAWKEVTIRVMLGREMDSAEHTFLDGLAKLVETAGVRFESQLLEA